MQSKDPKMESILHHPHYESLSHYVTVSNVVLLALSLAGLKVLSRIIYNLFISPLRDIPGPFWARITRLWELQHVYSGKMPETLIALHAKHGEFLIRR